MTYKIWYGEHKVFDIELFIKPIEEKSSLYYTEIKPIVIIEGLSRYVLEKIKTEDDLRDFVLDSDEIDDMRGLLFEGNWIIPNWTNDPLNSSAADARLCKIHKPKFVEIVNYPTINDGACHNNLTVV